MNPHAVFPKHVLASIVHAAFTIITLDKTVNPFIKQSNTLQLKLNILH